MNSAMLSEPALGARLNKIEAGKLVSYGVLVLLAHLALLLANRIIVFSLVKPHVSAALSSSYTLGFYASAASAVLFELMIFVMGWLFISGMANLLDGESNARSLFGALALCFAPVALCSLITFIVFLTQTGNVYTAALSQAENAEQLSEAIRVGFSGAAFQTVNKIEPVAYTLAVLLMVEAVNRVCRLSRLKSVLAVGLFVSLLFVLNYFTG